MPVSATFNCSPLSESTSALVEAEARNRHTGESSRLLFFDTSCFSSALSIGHSTLFFFYTPMITL
jgi:hypothetical protein